MPKFLRRPKNLLEPEPGPEAPTPQELAALLAAALPPAHLAPQAWLRAAFPSYVKHPFAARHLAFWEWVWSIRPETRPRPFVAIWPRGGAKSTSAELAVAVVGLRQLRPYGLYISETQSQADKHVATIASLFAAKGVERAVNQYGTSRGWRRNQLRTANGFTVDALGLDAAARGIKIDENRPGLMIFDDIDAKYDSPDRTQKKIGTMTSTILPAQAEDCAVLFVQNLIAHNSIASRLCDDRADFLIDRIISGPYPAVDDLQVQPRLDETLGKKRNFITRGTATWAGQSLEACQKAIDTYGLTSFLLESQQQVHEVEGALWTRALLERGRLPAPPQLQRVVVAVDPSGGRDAVGIVVAGLGPNGHAFVLADRTVKGELGPRAWALEVAKAYHEFSADRVVAERNFGGDMIRATLGAVAADLPLKFVTASRGKALRAEPIVAFYEDGAVHHTCVFAELETELTTWRPGENWSPNRLDALVWAITELLVEKPSWTKDPAAFAARYAA